MHHASLVAQETSLFTVPISFQMTCVCPNRMLPESLRKEGSHWTRKKPRIIYNQGYQHKIRETKAQNIIDDSFNFV